MLAGLFYALYVLIIGSIAAALFIAVDWLEPNRWYAFVLKFLILSFGAAAIARQFLQQRCRAMGVARSFGGRPVGEKACMQRAQPGY